jgi:hypothetical protein
MASLARSNNYDGNRPKIMTILAMNYDGEKLERAYNLSAIGEFLVSRGVFFTGTLRALGFFSGTGFF